MIAATENKTESGSQYSSQCFIAESEREREGERERQGFYVNRYPELGSLKNKYKLV